MKTPTSTSTTSTQTASNPTPRSPKLTSFIALRASGWSLASIAREISVPKSTLWDWDNKHQDEIHLLKHLQLEKLQEKYLPTYEEELSKLRSYLDRLEAALEGSHLGRMEPGGILQMILQVRGRMTRMREQLPLRNVPVNQPLAPLPFTGCVSRHNEMDFRREYFSEPTSSMVEKPEPATENPNRTNPDEIPGGVKNRPLKHNDFQQTPANGRPAGHAQNGHPNGNGKHTRNGSATNETNQRQHLSEPSASVPSVSSVFKSSEPQSTTQNAKKAIP